MDMFFEKIHSEEKCEDNGRPLAFFFVSVALVYFEDEVKEKEDGGRKEKKKKGGEECAAQRIRKVLYDFYNAAVEGAQKSFFSRVQNKYRETEDGSGMFSPYKLVCDISPLSECICTPDKCQRSADTAKSKKGKRAAGIKAYSGCEGCIIYNIRCFIYRRAKVVLKKNIRVAFRVSDGRLCDAD